MGLLVRQPSHCFYPDLAALASDAPGAWPGPTARLADRLTRWGRGRDQAVFALRSDRRTLAFVGFSLPTFFTGLLLILVFSIHLDWLPFIYRSDLDATGWRWYWEEFQQSVMPITVLGLFQGASWNRYVRAAVLDVIRLDYVTTARAKSLREHVVMIKHVLRNALIPIVTLVALQMPGIFGGAIRDGTNLSDPRDRLVAHQLDFGERHACHYVSDVRLSPVW